jgi:hypothetical protein
MGGAEGRTRTIDTRISIVKTSATLVNINIVVSGRIEQARGFRQFLIFIQNPLSVDGFLQGPSHVCGMAPKSFLAASFLIFVFLIPNVAYEI